MTGTQTLVGESKNTFTYTLKEGTKADNYTITQVEGTLSVTDGTGEDETPVNDSLVVTKTADKEAYALGATVTFKITATNIYAEAKTIKLSEIEGVTLAKDTFEEVAAGATIETTATYTITEEDILAGKFTNTVTATIDKLEKKADATAETEKANGHLTVTKVTTSTPKNGKAYALDEKITYKITVTNDGNLTITKIEVRDDLTGDKWTIDSLAPGASKEFTAAYTVTEADILAGQVVNVATAKGTSPDPDKPDVPVDPGKDPEPTDKPGVSMNVTKTITSTPEDNTGYKAGEEITYEITVTNTGNAVYTNVKVVDEMTGMSETIAELAVGETKKFTTKYTVTEDDIKAGKITNTVTANGDRIGNVTPKGDASVTTDQLAKPGVPYVRTEIPLGFGAGINCGETIE